MKNSKMVSVMALMSLLFLTACFGKKSSTNGTTATVNPDVISGVAATGAPISNGKVEIKGKNNETVNATTNSDGSYSANVADLEEPYLVKVLAPSGESYISVASQSALAEGKKINVTPLSHIIVSNVFNTTNTDDLFANFADNADDFSDVKLNTEKDKLKQKFKDAGLIGDNAIVSDNVDLLNGTLLAGTSAGVDGLLDVLDVNTGAADGIEVKLKIGGDTNHPLFTDKVGINEQDDAVASVGDKLDKAKAQLSVLDIARKFLENFAKVYSGFAHCNGDPSAINYQCDFQKIFDDLSPFFAASFQENGNSSIWGWICDSNVVLKSECKKVEFGNITFKDVNLVSYNPVTKKAVVSFNVYENGFIEGTSEFVLEATEENSIVSSFKFLGNQKTFRYWIETSSEHVTESFWNNDLGKSLLRDKYQMILNFWFSSKASYNFNGSETFTLKALSGNKIFNNGLSDSMPIYLVKYPNRDDPNSCVSSLSFSVKQKAYQAWDNTLNEYVEKSYEEVCPTEPNPCNCGNFNYESMRLNLSENEIKNMSKIERISLTSAIGAPITISDEFIIKKPMIVSQFTAEQVMPKLSITPEQFCKNTNPGLQLDLSAPVGILSYLSLYYSSNKTVEGVSTWYQGESRGDYWDENLKNTSFTPVFSNLPTDSQLQYRYLFLESRDENEQSFVRRINCATIQ